jgi:hypothetical protein
VGVREDEDIHFSLKERIAPAQTVLYRTRMNTDYTDYSIIKFF